MRSSASSTSSESTRRTSAGTRSAAGSRSSRQARPSAQRDRLLAGGFLQHPRSCVRGSLAMAVGANRTPARGERRAGARQCRRAHGAVGAAGRAPVGDAGPERRRRSASISSRAELRRDAQSAEPRTLPGWRGDRRACDDRLGPARLPAAPTPGSPRGSSDSGRPARDAPRLRPCTDLRRPAVGR